MQSHAGKAVAAAPSFPARGLSWIAVLVQVLRCRCRQALLAPMRMPPRATFEQDLNCGAPSPHPLGAAGAAQS